MDQANVDQVVKKKLESRLCARSLACDFSLQEDSFVGCGEFQFVINLGWTRCLRSFL